MSKIVLSMHYRAHRCGRSRGGSATFAINVRPASVRIWCRRCCNHSGGRNGIVGRGTLSLAGAAVSGALGASLISKAIPKPA